MKIEPPSEANFSKPRDQAQLELVSVWRKSLILSLNPMAFAVEKRQRDSIRKLEKAHDKRKNLLNG
jgi:hypothetical protein